MSPSALGPRPPGAEPRGLAGGLWGAQTALPHPPGKVDSTSPRCVQGPGVRPRRGPGLLSSAAGPLPAWPAKAAGPPRPGLPGAGGEAGLAGGKRSPHECLCTCPGDTGEIRESQRGDGGRRGGRWRAQGVKQGPGAGGAAGFESQQEPGPGSHPWPAQAPGAALREEPGQAHPGREAICWGPAAWPVTQGDHTRWALV